MPSSFRSQRHDTRVRLNDPSDYGIAGQGTGTGVTDDTAQTVTIGHTWTRTSNYVLAGHVGFTRMGENNKLPDFGQELGQSVLGLVNSNTPSNDKRYSGMPGITFGSGFTTLGTAQSWEPVFRNDWTLTLDENAVLTEARAWAQKVRAAVRDAVKPAAN